MLDKERGLYVAHCEQGPISICGKMANRHGLIAGATGTGKTVSLQVLAETFCQAGVPCFMADMKGDLSGISQPGQMSGFIEKRLGEFEISDPQFAGCPVRFYDVFGEQGHPMRTTISNMGPMLMSRLLGLNEVQSGVMDIIFRVADDKGLLLLDLKDLRAMTVYVSDHAAEYRTSYGNVTEGSIGAIQRALLSLESQGADKFFGEPAFDIFDLLQTNYGKGILSVLAADKLMQNPKLYSTFLLWLLSEIYSRLPEVGDLELPKFVFFFDEAHTLFEDTSKALVDKIEQVIRLIRSKGVGVYFVTQNPTDIPDSILGQLGNRIQHALRACTPRDQKAVRSAAETFRPNPAFKTEEAIMDLGTGEALVSFLDEKGSPCIVERAKILFPLSQIGAITAGQRFDIQAAIPKKLKEYEKFFDRESAFEVLTEINQQIEEEKEKERKALEKEKEKKEKEKEKKAKESGKSKKSGIGRTILGTMIAAAATSFARSAGTRLGKSIGGSGKTTSKKTTSTKKSTSSKNDSALKKATKTAVNSATRKVTTEILKSILK